MSTHVPPADATRTATWNSVHTAALETLPRSLRLLGVAAPDIDDLVQDVLLAAYESLDRFDPDYPASASPPPPREADSAVDPPQRDGRRPRGTAEARWLFGIAWRKVSKHLERAYRRREVPDGLHPAPRGQAVDPAPSSEQRVVERERLELAIDVLSTIAPERRVLLVLHEACDVPIVEIARELGINYNTAANRLRLAREDYRAAVARLRPDQREALRACWLPFPLASEFLVGDGGASTSAQAAPPPAPAPPASPAPPAAPLTAPAPLAAPAPPAAPPAAPAPPAPSGPPAPPPRSPATATLPRRPGRIALALGSAAAGVAGTVAVLLALAPPPALWARRFAPVLPELLPARTACLAATPPQQASEPGPGAPVIETPHRPCPAAPRAVPRAREASERDDTFAEELRLLTAARERLTAGDPAGALRQIAVHEQRFPGGQLKNVRERLRTVALARVAAPEQGATGSEPSR
ncbi:sigma-70 family RNA polymerase sigma factor [Sorangium sp. So ce281]|uniref:RNA polymerase sigma factor n=1 Tax=unclassified Sorangium TaxID=2621164 RepID=UPI003F61CBAD